MLQNVFNLKNIDTQTCWKWCRMVAATAPKIFRERERENGREGTKGKKIEGKERRKRKERERRTRGEDVLWV